MGIETLAIAALTSTVLGGALSAGGAIYGGISANNAAKYRAQVADNMAKQSRLIGEVEAQKQGMKTGAILGAQTAGQGASGIELGSGSAVDVRASTAQLGRLDEMTILNTATNKAIAYGDQATLERMSGKQSELEGWLKGSGSILGTVSSVSDKWLTYRTKGIF